MKQLRLLENFMGHWKGSSICVTSPEAALLIERGAAIDITPMPEAPKGQAQKAVVTVEEPPAKKRGGKAK